MTGSGSSVNELQRQAVRTNVSGEFYYRQTMAGINLQGVQQDNGR